MLWPARRSIGTLVPLVGILAGCGRQAAPLFKLLSPRHTGVTFANTITTNDTFTEAAAKYGIADTGYTTHAVFLDYDGDGDLDLFLLNNSPKDFARGAADTHPLGVKEPTPESWNKLYRNNGDGRFTDVSQQAGILRQIGYGLGVVVADVNRDGRPDIYVSNDVAPNDALYINNGNGTFTDKRAKSLKHTSFAGMGVDVADFNNDGWPDIAQMDMLPASLEQRKRMSGYLTYGGRIELRRRGFLDDYDANALQLSNGITPQGDVVFSDIAMLAGVAATDWSWSALLADFDNDGYKDLVATNGYPKAPNDLDYQTAVLAARRADDHRAALAQLHALRSYRVANHIFRNNGDLTFTDETKAWGMDQPGFSFGAAYADLDNDGRLDLVVNNMDGVASIYQNVQPRDSTTHYLEVALEGESPNRGGLGATLIVTAAVGGQKQYIYHSPYHGYMSTMDSREHFGLGKATKVDSLRVIWPDGRSQTLTGLAADRLITVRQADASTILHHPPPTPTTRHQLFQAAHLLSYKQPDVTTFDYDVQALLPYELSRQGPPLAVGDVNGDGLDDVFIGGAAGVPGRLFIQQKDGRFVESAKNQPWLTHKDYDDWGAVFFDANGDGRPDLFVIGRRAPRDYPYPARSYVLRNDGGHFTDVTAQVAPELAQPFGMVTAAVWVDFDGDGRLDLVTAGEWMPLQFFRNDGTHLRNVTASIGIGATRGWWWSLAVGDFNHDGRPDLIAGNQGLNFFYRTSPRSRFGIYAGDFSGDRNTDIVLTQDSGGTEVPVFGRAKLGPTIFPAALRFPSYGGFAAASVQQLFGPSELQRALHYQTDTFASLYLQNNGNGTFTAVPLPNLAQISPIRGIVVHDVDGDGHLDAIVAGNLFATEPNTTPADAGNGVWLKGDGRGHFTAIAPLESGFLAPHDVAGLALVKTPAGSAVLVANTADSLQAFTLRRP